jgi:hypothetical protein
VRASYGLPLGVRLIHVGLLERTLCRITPLLACLIARANVLIDCVVGGVVQALLRLCASHAIGARAILRGVLGEVLA